MTEEEQKTLSDDEILQRLEIILQKEEEFEKQIFEQQLKQMRKKKNQNQNQPQLMHQIGYKHDVRH